MWRFLIVFLALTMAQEEVDERQIPQNMEINEAMFDVIIPYELKYVNHPDALCLDGSQSAFYYYPGNFTEDSKKDLIVYFYGGGMCVDNESLTDSLQQIDLCETRRQDFFGSTNGYPETFEPDQGIMCNSRVVNPAFGRAAKIWLMYCDGSIWFKQMNKEIFKSILQEVNIPIERVLIFGTEVGSIYIMNNHKDLNEAVKETFGDQTKRFMILEGGMYLLSKEFENNQNDKLHNILEEVSQRIGKSVNELMNWNQLEEIDSKLFIVQPQYDWWLLNLSYDEDCHNRVNLNSCNQIEKARLNRFRKAWLKKILELTKKNDFGLWSLACVFKDALAWHEAFQEGGHKLPHQEGPTLHDALQRWFNEEESQNQHRYFDVDPWPSNKGCSYLVEDLFPGADKQENPILESLREQAVNQPKEDIIDDL